MFCETGGDKSDWGVVLLEENGVKENVEVGVYQRVCASRGAISGIEDSILLLLWRVLKSEKEMRYWFLKPRELG
jgi:hypothetical protein